MVPATGDMKVACMTMIVASALSFSERMVEQMSSARLQGCTLDRKINDTILYSST